MHPTEVSDNNTCLEIPDLTHLVLFESRVRIQASKLENPLSIVSTHVNRAMPLQIIRSKSRPFHFGTMHACSLDCDRSTRAIHLHARVFYGTRSVHLEYGRYVVASLGLVDKESCQGFFASRQLAVQTSVVLRSGVGCSRSFSCRNLRSSRSCLSHLSPSRTVDVIILLYQTKNLWKRFAVWIRVRTTTI